MPNLRLLILGVPALLAGVCHGQPKERAPLHPDTVIFKTTAEGVEILADVYRPRAGTGKRPGIVWIHGGGLMMGSRKSVPPQLLKLRREKDFVLVSLDYRLAPTTMIDEIVSDVKDGIEWVRREGPEKFDLNPERLVVTGASAGGYLTLMSGTVLKPPPTALVSYWGYGDIDGDWCNASNAQYGDPVDPGEGEKLRKEIGEKVLTSTNKQTGAARAKLFVFLKRNGGWGTMVSGFDPATERVKMAPWCPIQNVTAQYPPTLMLHGTKDKDVLYGCATRMKTALEKAGVRHELITVEGGGHGLWGGDRKDVEAAFHRSLDYISNALLAPSK